MKKKTRRLGKALIIAKAEEGKKNPSVQYEEVIEPKELQLTEDVKLVFSVSQNKNNDGNPHVDIRTHINTERYTGATKKGINFDIENLEEFIDILNELNKELEEQNL